MTQKYIKIDQLTKNHLSRYAKNLGISYSTMLKLMITEGGTLPMPPRRPPAIIKVSEEVHRMVHGIAYDIGCTNGEVVAKIIQYYNQMHLDPDDLYIEDMDPENMGWVLTDLGQRHIIDYPISADPPRRYNQFHVMVPSALAEVAKNVIETILSLPQEEREKIMEQLTTERQNEDKNN